jgi:hypothetical protein
MAAPMPHRNSTVRRYGDHMEQYADVVLSIEGQSWRMVMPDGAAKTGHSTNYPEPVSWAGRH